jgi:dTDP-4-amino-4,6-dideoxygalactose transaminase
MKSPIIPCAYPSAQFTSYQNDIEAAVLRVLRGNKYILGEEVEAFELEFSSYIGTGHAIGVANGTDALELALRAADINAGDEVITVSHTAVATVAAIESIGAVPVLVDISEESYTIDVSQLEQVLSAKTRAIIAVHLYGHPANLDALNLFCKSRSLVLIEDVSQAHGAKWKTSRVGSYGDIACFSCYPTKNLGAIGDAGMVVTSDERLANRVRALREYGWEDRYISKLAGRNSRLDEIQAAILRIKLRGLDADNARRRKIASLYNEILSDLPIRLPKVGSDVEHVYHLYAITTDRRRELIDGFKVRGIGFGIHYPMPIHLQPAYAKRIRTANSMEITEKVSNTIISLPMYPELSLADVNFVGNVINDILTN